MTLLLRVLLGWLTFSVLALAALVYLNARRPPCARRGHRWSTNYTATRLYLTCDVCGLVSPGWDLFVSPDGCQRYTQRRA